jgi:NADPH:quinone reductase-like Zn-dependent oxidoreductase
MRTANTVQIAKRCGYKVLATCSPANEAVSLHSTISSPYSHTILKNSKLTNSQLVKSMGADATINYKLDQATQLSHVESITAGNFSGVFETTASSAASAFDFLEKASKSDHKRFSTVDDWSQIDTPASITPYRIRLGSIGQSGERSEAITKDIASYIPYLESYLKEGSIRPLGVLLAGTGFEAVPEAIKLLDAGGRAGKKIVVKLQDL